MTWDPHAITYLGAYLGVDPPPDPVVRDHRGERPPRRDPRADQPLSPRVPPRDPRPRPRPDDRVPIPPQAQSQPPDPRVTTRPEDLFPRDRDRNRDRWHRHRRYRDQNDLPWGQRNYGDYVFLYGYGWLPRWYPYWDPQWFDYWWFLFDYYGGDTNADYAAYARDVFLRTNARRYGWL